MRAHEFLLEYRRDKTAQNFRAGLLQAVKNDHVFNVTLVNQLGQDATEDNIIDATLNALETIDPSKKNKNVMWLVKEYIKGNFRIEDHDRIKDGMEQFLDMRHQIKTAGHSPDLNSYSVGTLLDLIDEINQVELGQTGDLGDMSDQEHFHVLYKGPHGMLAIPKTHRAACQIGSGTRWCTATTDNSHMFDIYSKDGPLYVWIDSTGKYQFHFESGQYMDSRDVDIPSNQLQEWYQKNPVLQKFFDTKGDLQFRLKVGSTTITDDEIIDSIKNNAGTIKLVGNPSRKIQEFVLNKLPDRMYTLEKIDEDLLVEFIQNNYSHYSSEIKHFIRRKEFSRDVQLAIFNQNPMLITTIQNPDKDLILQFVHDDPEEFFSSYQSHQDNELFASRHNITKEFYMEMFESALDGVIKSNNKKLDSLALSKILNPEDGFADFVNQNHELLNKVIKFSEDYMQGKDSQGQVSIIRDEPDRLPSRFMPVRHFGKIKIHFQSIYSNLERAGYDVPDHAQEELEKLSKKVMSKLRGAFKKYRWPEYLYDFGKIDSLRDFMSDKDRSDLDKIIRHQIKTAYDDANEKFTKGINKKEGPKFYHDPKNAGELMKEILGQFRSSKHSD